MPGEIPPSTESIKTSSTQIRSGIRTFDPGGERSQCFGKKYSLIRLFYEKMHAPKFLAITMNTIDGFLFKLRGAALKTNS